MTRNTIRKSRHHLARRVVLALTGVTIAATALVGGSAGDASAQPTEAPRLGVYGEDIWSFDPNCQGPIHVGLKTDPRQPGKVFATYRPGRFNRTCTVRVWANWGLGTPGQNWSQAMRVGPRGGKSVTKVLPTGRGLQAMGFGVPGPHKSVSYYLITP